ncbi:MAG: hypothetical protein JSS35_11115 [Proteobacteria bacterium]|nr:hypothetical protein [Pseudomonadota bacterium]
MTVRLDGEVIHLEGDCHVEDAEVLLRRLQEAPGRGVDLSQCRRMHAALAQVLLSFRTPILAAPQDSFLRDRLLPNFQRSSLPGEGPMSSKQDPSGALAGSSTQTGVLG